MAHLYDATLTPSKLELLTAWLPSRSWFSEDGDLRKLGAYRFDDPAGEVGIESFLLQAGDGAVVHVPLTYRGGPLDGAEDYLVGNTDHSVLGKRWVYDACGDPAWATALASAALTGGTQAEEFLEVDGQLQPRRPSATVQGSGTSGAPVESLEVLSSRDVGQTTLVQTRTFEIVVVRVIGADVVAPWTLTGHWDGGGQAVLAGVAELT